MCAARLRAQKSRKIGPQSRLVCFVYHIWELKKVGFKSELRTAVGGTFDPELFHAVSQGVRVHTESFGGTVRALDDTMTLL